MLEKRSALPPSPWHERALQVRRPRPRCSSTKQDGRHALHQSLAAVHSEGVSTKAIGRKQFEASSTVPLSQYP
eukprot:3474383-Amphidinium_carterae.1